MAAAPPDNPNYGQVFTKGVKYIKIHKLDKDGEDYGPQLASADNITINYSDVGSVQYNILTTQQQEDYYLMGVVPQEITSSLNNIKDWDLHIGKFTMSETLTPLDVIVFDPANQGVMTVLNGTNTGGYYNEVTGLYSFNLGNVPLSVTSSINVTSVVGSPIYISVLIPSSSVDAWVEGLPPNLWETYGVQALNIISITGNGNYTITSSLNDNFGGEFYIGGVNFSLFGGEFTIISAQEEINQGQSSYDSPDEVLLNIQPEVSNFEYSDYNAVFGNAVIPQFSSIYQDVDYNSNGGPIPVNFNLIISGAAKKAQVQDSNYTQTGWSNGRYNGSRNSSTDFNQ